MAKSATKAKKGLSPKMFKGLDKKRIEKKGGGAGKRLVLDKNKTLPIQFLTKPEEFIEYEIHVFQEDGRWEFIPCAGDACPLCVDDDSDRAKTSYRFACNVYNLKDKKVQILEGPKDLAGRIFYRYERKPKQFLKRTFELTKFGGPPVTYDFQAGEDDPVQLSGLKAHSLEEYLKDEMKRYFGEDLEAVTSSSLEDDDDLDDDLEAEDDDIEDDDDDDLDDDDEDEDEDDEDDDLEDDDEDEDDEEDDDDFDDEDDDDEEDEPVKKKAPVKKAPVKKKAVAKKAPASKKR